MATSIELGRVQPPLTPRRAHGHLATALFPMATLGATHPAHPHNRISMPLCHTLSLSHQEHLCPWYQPPLVPRSELVPMYLITFGIAHPTHPHDHSSVPPCGGTAPYPQPQPPRRVLPRPSSLPAATLSRGTLKVKVSAAKPGWQGAASSHRRPHTCPREASALSPSAPSVPSVPPGSPAPGAAAAAPTRGSAAGRWNPTAAPWLRDRVGTAADGAAELCLRRAQVGAPRPQVLAPPGPSPPRSASPGPPRPARTVPRRLPRARDPRGNEGAAGSVPSLPSAAPPSANCGAPSGQR